MIALIEGITDSHLTDLYQDRYIQRIGYDDRKLAPIHHPLAKYLSAYINNVFVGAFLVVSFSKREYEIHSLLMRSAVSRSRELGSLAIDWVFTNKDVLRITANVLCGLETVKNYCVKLGFQLEGVKRSVCTRDGKPLDMYVLGLLRQNWGK